MHYFANHLEPVCNFDVYILFMTFPVYRPNSPRFELGLTYLKGSSPVLAWGLNWFVRRGPPAGKVYTLFEQAVQDQTLVIKKQQELSLPLG